MAPLHRCTLSGRFEAFEGVCAWRFKQAVAWRPVVDHRQHGHERAVDQRIERIQHGPPVEFMVVTVVGDNALDQVERCAAVDDAEAPKHFLFPWRQKGVAPLERRKQRLLPRWRAAVATCGKELQPILHRGEQ